MRAVRPRPGQAALARSCPGSTRPDCSQPPTRLCLCQVLLLDELTTFLDGDDQENVLACVRAVVDASRPRRGGESRGGGSGGSGGSGSNTASRSDSSSGGGGSGAAAPDDGKSSSSEGGVTALWVTHRLEELRWADAVSYMDQGRVVFTGSPEQAQAYMRRLGAHV